MKKQPKQERSQRIVEAVLEGATRILSKTPLSQASTNKIAEIAGVGIGSLYDYFPNKKSIVTLLIDRHMDKILADFKSLLEAAERQSIDEQIENFLSFFETEFFGRKDFLREIFQLAPETGRMEILFEMRIEAVKLLSAHILKKLPDLGAEASELKAFFLIHGLMGILESYVMQETVGFSAGDLKNELRKTMRFILLES